MSFIWQAIDYSFKLICLLVTIFLVGQGFHFYMQNDDSTTISFKSFYTTPDLVYPSGSVCFTSPYEGDKLNKRYNITRISDYSDFLSGDGDSWNISMLGIDYDEMSLKPLDYIMGYKVKYRNGTEETKIYNESKNEDLVLPTIRLIMPNLICLGIDIKMSKEMVLVGIIIKMSIFSDMNSPTSTDGPFSYKRALSVVLHYPNQILNAKWWKDTWTTRSNEVSKSYAINYDIRGVEVIRLRNKNKLPCHASEYDYDSEVLEEIMNEAKCRPPYATSRSNLELCNKQTKMKRIKVNHFNHFSGLNLKHQPCNLMVKVNYEVTETDISNEEGTTFSSFTVNFNFKDDQVKVIQMVRRLSFWSMVGNVGGYVGMFLGYTLMMIPEQLKKFGSCCMSTSEARS